MKVDHVEFNNNVSNEQDKEEFLSFPNDTFKSRCGRHNIDGIDIRFKRLFLRIFILVLFTFY